MKLKIKDATFDAEAKLFFDGSVALFKQLDGVQPVVVNYWDCAAQTAAPTPPTTVLDAQVLIGFEATERDWSNLFKQDLTHSSFMDLDDQLDAHRKDLHDSTIKLATWFRGIAGFASDPEMGLWLGANFGREKLAKFDFDAVIAPWKDKYSLRVETKARRDWVRLTHPKMPAFAAASIYLGVPTGLRHEVQKTHECTEEGKLRIRNWRRLPPIGTPEERLPSKTDGQRQVRKAKNRLEQEQVRDELRRLAKEKARAEEKLKAHREEMTKLEEETP